MDTNIRIRFDIAYELRHLLMRLDYYSEEDKKIVRFIKNLKIGEIALRVGFFCRKRHF